MSSTPANEKFLTKPLLVIFLTILIDLIGFGIVIPLLPFYAERFDANPFDVGMLVASYSAMQFIFSPILGGLSDRFGRRPILFASILGSGIGYLTIGFAGALWMVFLGRIIGGVTAGNLSTAQAYIADVTSRENRAKGMGLFGMAFGLGFILGPALAGVFSQYGVEVPFYVAAGMSFFNAALLYFVLPETRTATRRAETPTSNRVAALVSSFKDKRLATINLQYFLVVAAFSMMTTAFAYFTKLNYGFGAEQTGYLLAYVGFIAVVIQGGVFGKLAKRFGEAQLVIVGCAILILSLAAVPFVTYEALGLTGLLIGTACFAFGNSLASPSLTSLASKNASEEEQGKTMGVLQSGASLARVIGPALSGVLLNNHTNQIDPFTLKRNFWVAAGIMVFALVAAVFYRAIDNGDQV